MTAPWFLPCDQESGRLVGTESVAAPFGVGCWDPHHGVQLSVAQGGDLVGFDIRSQWCGDPSMPRTHMRPDTLTHSFPRPNRPFGLFLPVR